MKESAHSFPLPFAEYYSAACTLLMSDKYAGLYSMKEKALCVLRQLMNKKQRHGL